VRTCPARLRVERAIDFPDSITTCTTDIFRDAICVSNPIKRQIMSDLIPHGACLASSPEERLHTGRSLGWPILPWPYGKRLCSASIGQLDFPVEDLGEQALKNIAQPVHVFRVLAEEKQMHEPTATPPTLFPRRRQVARVGVAELSLEGYG
jgi:hypothetical protein